MSSPGVLKAAKASADFWKKLKSNLFWIVGIAVIFIISYAYYNNMNKPTAGTLVFIGGFMALYYYWIKFFVVDASKKDWPPYQSTCPDFLTLVPPGSGYVGDSKDFLCVDFVGVSINGGLKKIKPEELNATTLQDPTKVFRVNMDRYSGKKGITNLKQDLSDYGLSWEAMLKGSSISVPNAPVNDDEYDVESSNIDDLGDYDMSG